MSDNRDKDGTGKLAQDWLSGKVGKGDAFDIYAREMEGRQSNHCKDYPPFSGPNSSYNRSYREHIDLDLVSACLVQMLVTNEPLPHLLTLHLIWDIDLLKSNREGRIFRHGKNPTCHPTELQARDLVIAYVETSRERGLDCNPMKTIREELGIPKSTYYEWKKKTTGYPVFPKELYDDEEMIFEMKLLWWRLVNHYKPPE